MSGPTIVTPFAKFYKTLGAEGVRYFAETKREKANEYATGASLPPLIQGFGVFDTTVSTEYAVAVYGSEAEAKAHDAVEAPAPATAMSEEAPAEPTPEPEAPEPFETTEDAERYTAPAKPAKRGGRKPGR